MNIDWVTIPELILVEFFSNLPFRDRFNASLVCDSYFIRMNSYHERVIFIIIFQVCRNWSHIFQTAKLWHRITINDDWFNKTVPIQIDEDDVIVPSPILDYDRATKYLFSVGHHVRSIVIEPMDNFNLLYQSLTLIDWFIEQKVMISHYLLKVILRKGLFSTERKSAKYSRIHISIPLSEARSK